MESERYRNTVMQVWEGNEGKGGDGTEKGMRKRRKPCSNEEIGQRKRRWRKNGE